MLKVKNVTSSLNGNTLAAAYLNHDLQDMEGEVWNDIPMFDGIYQASDNHHHANDRPAINQQQVITKAEVAPMKMEITAYPNPATN
ncbi:MAG: hypothetical protein ACXWWC_09435 [Chitinophagaceae bacterium]